MNSRRLVIAVALFVSAALSAASPAIPATPAARHRPAAPASVRSYDLARKLDINSLNFVVTNYGPLGYDLVYGGPGLFFPRGTPNTVLFASGLWLGGLVGGDHRLALSEYSSEFTPGAMIGTLPDDPSKYEYAVWKVLPWKGDPADTTHVDRTPAELAADPTLDPVAHHSWNEYMTFAAPHGAPVTDWILPGPGGVGTQIVPGPAVIGDQMLWCVYNDADPASHTAFPGGTLPLGIEVHQSVFGFAAPGPAGQTAFIRWKLFNKSGGTIDSTRVAYWLDPDLGGFTDDLVGSDSAASLGFTYNASNNDAVYGFSPPALGVDLLNEAFDPSRGRNLGMTSFGKYISGTDPASNAETWNVLQGLEASGGYMLDPFTLMPTWYAVSGDPVLGTGWLDAIPADRRMLLARGPRTLAPGDSIEVWAALVVAQADSRLESVQLMKCWDLWVQQLYASGFQTAPAPPDCGITSPPASCPRPLGFYASECEGGPHLNPSQLEVLAAGIDNQSTLFTWPPAPDGAATFCSVLNDATDVRAQAKGEFATLLANALATPLGVVPAGTTPIRLDLSAPVSIPGVPATNIFELIAPAGPNGLVADYHNLNAAHRTPIVGVNAGLESFGGGAGYGISFFGSTLDPVAMPDSFHTVRIRFDASNPQKAYRYLRLEKEDGTAPPQGRAYLYGGFHDVPFEAIDDLTGERLDVAFVERTVVDEFGTILGDAFQVATFDSTWGPDPSSVGGREYLFVTSRPYAGAPRAEFAHDGAIVDFDVPPPVLYAIWCMRIDQTDVFDDNDEFVFQNGLIPGPGADGLLIQLEGQPLSDPDVVLAYEQLRDGLGAINRGESLPSVCDDPTPAFASLVSAIADPDRVRVEWSVDAAGEVTVERTTETEGWATAGTAMADGTGRVRWEDTAVEPGKRYGYRLALGAGGGAPYAGEAWVEVPRVARLAIAGLTPNPGGPNASIVFSLASSERATIELVDLAGRRVFSREVGPMGPGTHSLSLGGRIAPGVYWLRLTQGERSVKARGVILQ